MLLAGAAATSLLLLGGLRGSDVVVTLPRGSYRDAAGNMALAADTIVVGGELWVDCGDCGWTVGGYGKAEGGGGRRALGSKN